MRKDDEGSDEGFDDGLEKFIDEGTMFIQEKHVGPLGMVPFEDAAALVADDAFEILFSDMEQQLPIPCHNGSFHIPALY